MAKENLNLLINLPEGFFKVKDLEKEFNYLGERYNIKKRSHNTQEEIQQDLTWADAVFMWAWPDISEEMLDKCPNLKFIGQLNSTQTTVISALNKDIVLSEVRHSWSPAVAEMALGLMLSGLRKISHYHIAMRNTKEEWVEDFPVDIDTSERQLTGRTVGIVGFGRIGQIIAKLLEPFKVELNIYDPYLPEEIADKYGIQLSDIDKVVEDSEVLVLCAANNKGSENTITKKHINSMAKDTVLVNVGRASLIDMAALEKRLKKGELIAMLDVFEKEPLEEESSIRGLKNAFLTPHRAGGIMASLHRGLTMLSSDLKAYLEGDKMKYRVSKDILNSLPE